MVEESRAAWAKAFAAAQAAFPEIAKGRTAEIPTKSGGKYAYSYADLSDIRRAVVGVLAEHGLSFAQSVAGDGQHVAVTTRIYHEQGHIEEFGPTVLASPGDARAVGSAITYARRYALAAALGIVPEDDDDGAIASESYERRREERRQEAAKPPPEKPAARLGRVLLELVGDLDESRALAVEAKNDLKLGDGWADDDGNVDRVIERARQIVQNRANVPSGPTSEATAETGSDGDSWDGNTEAWSKLYDLIDKDPTLGTMVDVEQRTRYLYQLMSAVGLWKDTKTDTGQTLDPLHAALAAEGLDHFGDLKVKANYQRFAKDSFESAKAALEEHAKKEAGAFPADTK